MVDQPVDPFQPLFDLLDAQELQWAETAAQAAQTMKLATDRLDQIQGARTALQTVRSEEPSESEIKLAPTIRNVFKTSGSRSFSAVEMRDAVLQAGFTPSKNQNLLAAVHGVLKRMAQPPNQELKVKTRKDETTAYFVNPGVPITPTDTADRPKPAYRMLIEGGGNPSLDAYRQTMKELSALAANRSSALEGFRTLMQQLNSPSMKEMLARTHEQMESLRKSGAFEQVRALGITPSDVLKEDKK